MEMLSKNSKIGPPTASKIQAMFSILSPTITIDMVKGKCFARFL